MKTLRLLGHVISYKKLVSLIGSIRLFCLAAPTHAIQLFALFTIRTTFVAIIALILAFKINVSTASPITFEFYTQVDLFGVFGSSSSLFSPYINPGDFVTGSFTFDSMTVDASPDPVYGIYNNAITAAEIHAGSLTFMLDPLGSSIIEAQHYYEAGYNEFYNQYTAEWDLAPILGITGLTASYHLEQFYVPPSSPQLVSSDELPLWPPDASLINETSFFWILGYSSDQSDPEFTLGIQFSTTLSQLQLVRAVPIPPSVWLFGSGLLGLIGIARRKKLA